MSQDAHSDQPVWFITGCSTGFGRELARLALAGGDRLVATARKVEQIRDLVGEDRDKAAALRLDVTDKQQIAAAVAETLNRFGRIDYLVNNAGYGYLSTVEEGTDEDIRAMFEANFFGLAEVTRAVLPVLRRQKSGHVINISSVGGLVGFPGAGYYNATKFAVEGLSEALAKEVEPLGIKVTLVEPGPFRTDWAGRSLQPQVTRIADYDRTAGDRVRQAISNSGNQPGDPVRAAQAIIDITRAAKPPLHLVLGKPGYENVRRKLDALLADLDTWEATTFGADFPG